MGDSLQETAQIYIYQSLYLWTTNACYVTLWSLISLRYTWETINASNSQAKTNQVRL